MNKEELIATLAAGGINTDQWGKPPNKGLDDFLREVNLGESELVVTSGTVLRKVRSVGMRVFYLQGDTILNLWEEKQVFADGTERCRNLDSSMSETVLPGETTENTVHRGLQEELNICATVGIESQEYSERGPVQSYSYPGLKALYCMQFYRIILPDEVFKSEGYVEFEVATQVTTYFRWRKVG